MAAVPAMTEIPGDKLLRLLAGVSSLLRTLANQLRQRPTVHRVHERVDLEQTADRATIEWYVDSELADGTARSFRLLLIAGHEEWIIESAVRRIRTGGSETEVALPARSALDSALEEELTGAAQRLLETAKRVVW